MSDATNKGILDYLPLVYSSNIKIGEGNRHGARSTQHNDGDRQVAIFMMPESEKPAKLAQEQQLAEEMVDILNEYPELKRREQGLILALAKIQQQKEELELLRKTVAELNAYARREERDFGAR